MSSHLLITNARLVNEGRIRDGDLLIRDGRIARIGSAPVIIAGFGRYGQIVGRLLFTQGVTATVLDHDPDQIEALKKAGLRDRVLTIVGGAPVTEDFAKRNGVDLFGKDANDGVLVIEKAMESRKIRSK